MKKLIETAAAGVIGATSAAVTCEGIARLQEAGGITLNDVLAVLGLLMLIVICAAELVRLWRRR